MYQYSSYSPYLWPTKETTFPFSERSSCSRKQLSWEREKNRTRVLIFLIWLVALFEWASLLDASFLDDVFYGEGDGLFSVAIDLSFENTTLVKVEFDILMFLWCFFGVCENESWDVHWSTLKMRECTGNNAHSTHWRTLKEHPENPPRKCAGSPQETH
jgi:hypothetical protein